MKGPKFVLSRRDAALRRLKVVKKKLSKVGELSDRLDLERAPVSPDEYVRRLLVAKADAKKEFKEATFKEGTTRRAIPRRGPVVAIRSRTTSTFRLTSCHPPGHGRAKSPSNGSIR